MVKIIRIDSGEEIMATIVSETENVITLKDPCVLVPSQEGKLMFVKWLPYADLKNGITIDKKNVVFMIDALKDLEDHYTGAISNNLFIPTKKVITPSLSLA